MASDGHLWSGMQGAAGAGGRLSSGVPGRLCRGGGEGHDCVGVQLHRDRYWWGGRGAGTGVGLCMGRAQESECTPGAVLEVPQGTTQESCCCYTTVVLW